MRSADHTRFALTGLAAPLGILGADAGASYGLQEPRVSSRLLSLRPLPYGRHQSGASRIAFLVTLRNGKPSARYVTVWEQVSRPYTYTLTLKRTGPVDGRQRAPLAIAIGASPTPSKPLKLRGGFNASYPAPPLKQKRPRRVAPHCACASKRPRLVLDNRKPKRGVFVTPPSRITPA